MRTLELRISQMARKMPANSWTKIFAPRRVCHQECGSYSESGAATTRRMVPAGKVRSQMYRARRVWYIRGDQEDAFPAASGNELGECSGFVLGIFRVLIESNDGAGGDAAIGEVVLLEFRDARVRAEITSAGDDVRRHSGFGITRRREWRDQLGCNCRRRVSRLRRMPRAYR